MSEESALISATNLGCSVTCKDLSASIRFYRDAIGFAVVPSLMVTIGGSGATTPIGVLILGVILVVVVPLAVAARGATPNGGLPSLAGARWADVQEALIVLGVGWLAWAVLVIVGRVLEGRGGAGASR